MHPYGGLGYAGFADDERADRVYEGKSMQGMIDLIGKGFFAKGSNILYAHLGGAPALNGYSYTYRNG